METEMKTKTAYVVATKFSWESEFDFKVFDFIPDSDSSVVYVKVSEFEVALPDISQDEIQRLAAGVELESLLAEKEKINAETFRRLAQIDERIGQLQALEDLS